MPLTDVITLSPVDRGKPERLLVVSTRQEVHDGVEEALSPERFNIDHAWSRKEGLGHFLDYRNSVVIVDVTMLPARSVRLIELFRYVHKYTAILIATEPGGLSDAVDYMRRGAGYDAIEFGRAGADEIARIVHKASAHLSFVAQNLFARYLIFTLLLSLPLWGIGVYGLLRLLSIDLSMVGRLLAAHLVGDIVTYVPIISRTKRSPSVLAKVFATGTHATIHGLLAWVCLWGIDPGQKVTAAVGIGLLHFLVDFSRILIEGATVTRRKTFVLKRMDILRWVTGRSSFEVDSYMREYYLGWFLLNVGDQVAHLATIVAVVASVAIAGGVLLW